MRHPVLLATSLALLFSCAPASFGGSSGKPKPELKKALRKERQAEYQYRLEGLWATSKAYKSRHFTQQQRRELAQQLLREGIEDNYNSANPPQSYAERLGWKVTMLAQTAKN